MRYLFVCVRRSICSLSLSFPEQHTFNSIWIEYRKTKALRRHLSHGNRNNNVYARKRKKEYRNKERKLILKSNEKPYQSTNTNTKTHKLCTTYVDFSKFFLFFLGKEREDNRLDLYNLTLAFSFSVIIIFWIYSIQVYFRCHLLSYSVLKEMLAYDIFDQVDLRGCVCVCVDTIPITICVNGISFII